VERALLPALLVVARASGQECPLHTKEISVISKSGVARFDPIALSGAADVNLVALETWPTDNESET